MILKNTERLPSTPSRALSLLSPALPQFGTVPSVDYGQFFSGPSPASLKPKGGPS